MYYKPFRKRERIDKGLFRISPIQLRLYHSTATAVAKEYSAGREPAEQPFESLSHSGGDTLEGISPDAHTIAS
jgi:hypothetical protein